MEIYFYIVMSLIPEKCFTPIDFHIIIIFFGVYFVGPYSKNFT